jgi:hypothetical protein
VRVGCHNLGGSRRCAFFQLQLFPGEPIGNVGRNSLEIEVAQAKQSSTRDADLCLDRPARRFCRHGVLRFKIFGRLAFDGDRDLRCKIAKGVQRASDALPVLASTLKQGSD